MSDCYFILMTDADGTSIERLTKHELTERINGGYYGDPEWLDGFPPGDSKRWDLQSTEGVVIIKGDIIQPRVVETITRVKLP